MGNTAILAGLALLVATLAWASSGRRSRARGRTGSGSSAAVADRVRFRAVCVSADHGRAGAAVFLRGSTGWLSIAPGSLALPLLALALPLAAIVERLQSHATAEAVDLPASSRRRRAGVPRARLIWVHALRPSLRPVLGVSGIVIATLFSGSVAVETITSWPGLGLLMLDALRSRDVFLVAGCALAGALLVALGNLVADVLRALVDPRVEAA